MKSLPQFVNDMKATAELLREQADQLDELVKFFGGVVQLAPAPHASPPKAVTVSDPMPAAGMVSAGVVGPPPIKRKRGAVKGRMLTKAEKAEIKADWNEIPPQLRTKTNRAALAAKYNCSPMQVWALARDKEELQGHLQGGRKLKGEASNQPSPPSPDYQTKSHGVQ